MCALHINRSLYLSITITFFLLWLYGRLGRAAEQEWTERNATDWHTPCRKFLAMPLIHYVLLKMWCKCWMLKLTAEIHARDIISGNIQDSDFTLSLTTVQTLFSSSFVRDVMSFFMSWSKIIYVQTDWQISPTHLKCVVTVYDKAKFKNQQCKYIWYHQYNITNETVFHFNRNM